jgi:hypothetical protein
LTIAITIDAIRQAIRIAIEIRQEVGMPES